jgi:hypothetical protein
LVATNYVLIQLAASPGTRVLFSTLQTIINYLQPYFSIRVF